MPRPIMIAYALLLMLFACDEGERQERPLALVHVRADLAVAQRLQWIEARFYDDDGDAGEPVVRQRFPLVASGMGNEKIVTLPFSFTVTQRKADSFLVAVVGFESFAPDAQPLVEARGHVYFDAAKTTSVSLHLAAACVGRVLACGGLGCEPTTGACVSLEPAIIRTEPTTEPAQAANLTLDARVLDASIDVNVKDAAIDAAPVATLPELPPEVLPACPVENACPLSAYPCVPSDDKTSYSCRGQFAAWPMPEEQPGAKQAPHYTVDPAQRTVLDEVTGLLWQLDLPDAYAGCSGQQGATLGDTCSQPEAEHYCSQLRLAGVRWRLPTKIELESTLSLRGDGIVNEDVFGDTPIDFYWSGSPVLLPVCTSCSYAVGVLGGNAFANDLTYHVRCVHSARNPGAPPGSRFEVDEQLHVARDRYTGLTWVRGVSKESMTLQEANDLCTRSGYRVPTLKEALTLADLTREESAISLPTLIGGRNPVWTSTVLHDQLVLYSPPIAGPFPFKPDEFPPHAVCVR